ncbi:hypothetical protein DFH27DRAFT_26784 [Peziza echinospora]|nr:hypothetical protein DFH27DRAFT_26784 [Peziza echinospora]
MISLSPSPSASTSVICCRLSRILSAFLFSFLFYFFYFVIQFHFSFLSQIKPSIVTFMYTYLLYPAAIIGDIYCKVQ